MPAGFAEDFFLGQGCTKHVLLNSLLTANAALPAPEAKSDATEEAPRSERFAVWADQLRAGFSLLVHGVGSKKQLLTDFVDEVVRPAGVALTHLNAFDARFSLCEWFKALLEIAFPNAARSGVSAEALGAAVRAATETSSRPLCIVVHSLELLPQHHIVILSSLATCPGVHLVASVDSIWAPLAWSSCCSKNFNFCREEWNTFLSYEVESAARYPSGLPPWTGLGHDRRRAPKASLSLVLRSLTNNHRELVQAMAKRQLENGNRVGISLSALLKESTERMIAASVPKLRSLLNELKDHEVVIQRNSSAASAQMLFSLPYNDRMLQRLAQNTSLDSEDEADEVVGGGGEDEDIAAE
jgi:origin recognition complex subunit 2